jgi:hypothetical protein
MRPTITLLVAGLLIAGPVSADDAEGRFVVLGYGVQSCGAYVTERSGGNDNPFRGWLTGYLTRYNYAVGHTYNMLGSTDLDGALLWLENYCRANPLDDFEIATRKLIAALSPKKQTTKP